MADTGAIIIGTGSNVDRSGGFAWSNPTRLNADDTSYTTSTITSSADSDWLVGVDLSSPIPSGSTIDGIEVLVQGYVGSGGAEIDAITLWSGGSPLGTAKTPAQALSGSTTNYTYGSSSDTWGASLSDTVVNDAGFGAAVGAGWLSGGFAIALFDYMSITVYYTLPVLEGSATATQAQTATSVATATRPGAASASQGQTATSAGTRSNPNDPTWIETIGSPVLEQLPISLMLFDEHRRERLDIDINSRMTSVQVSTAVNRGFDQLQVGIAPARRPDNAPVTYGQLPDPIDIRSFARVELRIGGYVAFEGRLMPTGVPATQIVARGYWDALASDDWFASSDTTQVSVGSVIKTMLAASTLSVRPGNGDQFRDPLTTHAPDEFDGRTVADALSLATSEGDTLGNTVDWYVWEDKLLWLVPRSEPSEVDYRFDLDPQTMQVAKDPSQMYSGITIEYTISANGSATITSGNTSIVVSHGLGVAPAQSRIRFFGSNNPTNDPGNAWVDTITTSSFTINVRNDPGASGASFTWFADVPGQRTDEATNTAFIDEFGFQRRTKESVGSMTLAAAQRIRDSLIVDARRPRYSARIRVGAGEHLRGPRNEPVAPYVARAGQWVRIADLPPLMIVSTRYDAMTKMLDIDVGDRLATMREQLRRLQLAEERRGRNINPVSGGAIA